MAETAKKRVRSKASAKSARPEASPDIPDEEAPVIATEETPRAPASIDDEEEPQHQLAERLQLPQVVRHEERLQKIIAAAGVTSRRKAEELIAGGRVQVNGTTIDELGAKADAALDHIRVDGKLLAKPGQGANRLRYAVLNKPKGYITTASDPEGRPTIMEFFPGKPRVFPVGRLDYQSEGLLLMTNDGELANLLTRAATKVQKVYLVKISGKPSDEALNQLRAGIMIDKGRTKDEHLGRVLTQPAGIRRVRDADNPWYEVTLTEGRNREIRKMFEEVGHFVEKIRRVGFGPLVLDIEPGQVRELTPEEVLALQRAARGIRGSLRSAAPPVSVPALRRKAKRQTIPTSSPALSGRPLPTGPIPANSATEIGRPKPGSPSRYTPSNRLPSPRQQSTGGPEKPGTAPPRGSSRPKSR